eukprot:COSAG05_NODE_7455_length_809_cov_1.297183_1_plen_53_part_01
MQFTNRVGITALDNVPIFLPSQLYGDVVVVVQVPLGRLATSPREVHTALDVVC